MEAPIEAVKPTGEVVAMTEVVEPPPVETAAVQSTSLSELAQNSQPVATIGIDWIFIDCRRLRSFRNFEAAFLSERVCLP